MSKAHQRTSSVNFLRSQRIGSLVKWICWFACVLLVSTALSTRADEEEDQYFAVLGIIQKADALESSGQTGKALTKYQEAQRALVIFHRDHLDWNPPVIAYRTKYLADKIALCSQKLAAPAASPTAPQAATNTGNESTTSESGVQLKLLEPGGEPRQVLRLHPKAGAKQTLSMTLKMAMAMKVGEMENPPMKLPGMVMTFELTIKDVSAQGDISFELLVTGVNVADEPGVLPQVADAMKASVGGLKGLSGKGVISNRGVNKGTEIALPSGADPQIRQAMDQMKDSFANLATPLPQEAVGSGAKWEVRLPLKTQGMSIEQTTSYELASLKDDSLAAHLTLNQTAPPQKVQNPAMPAVKLGLLKMSGTGTGEINLNLTQLMPTTGNISSHSDVLLGVGTGAQQQKMSMKMDLEMQLETK